MITTDSLLPPSEPPDLNNWFSTYQNESFVLETNDNFGFSELPDHYYGSMGDCAAENKVQTSRERVINDDTLNTTPTKSRQPNDSQIQDSDSPLLTPVESEPPGIENWFSSYAYESPVLDDIDEFILPGRKENTVVGDGKQRKEVEKDENLSCVPSDELNCYQTLEACDTYNGSTEDRKNSTRLPNEGANVSSPKNVNQMLPRQSPNEGADVNSPKNVNQISPRQSPEAISLDDANGDGDGFVSIKSKSKREKYDNSMCGDQKRASSCVSKMKKGNESAGRKILGDVTNIDEHSGKWKCPRKRKPDIGPPLKQLRLGQWFHYA